MNKLAKPVSHYLSLPYTIRLRRDEEGDVVARIEELPGCISHGANEAEALKNLREMQKLWLDDCVATGQPIPEPEDVEPLPSGKWVQRVPRSLHRRLAEQARVEGVSLNQLVTSMLAQQLGARSLPRPVEPMLTPHAGSRQQRRLHS
jgi:predicted RNase H-like HicB family nuclease